MIPRHNVDACYLDLVEELTNKLDQTTKPMYQVPISAYRSPQLD